MSSKVLNIQNIIVGAIIIAAALSRLIPNDLHNFTPIIAMALFGGAFIKNRFLAVGLPLGAMLLSDAFLGFHASMPFVYLSIAGAVILGRYIIKKNTAGNVLAGSLFSAILFFIISNLGHWMVTGMYAMSFSGLMACYTAAIPFFRMTLLSTFVFSGVFFGSYYLLQQRIPNLSVQKTNK